MEELITTDTPITNGVEPPAQAVLKDAVAMRQHIFGRKHKRPEVLIPVPEWDCTVLIVAMNGEQRYEYTGWLQSQDPQDPAWRKKLNFHLVSTFCLHPETRKTFIQAGDYRALMTEDEGAIVDMLAQTVVLLSKVDGSTVEQARKNLLAVTKSTAIDNSRQG